MNLIRQRTVLPLAVAAYLLPIVIMEYKLLALTQGTFPYPIDDTCIHLAIAKNIAFHQVWGISPVEFTSAASSILYPLILAATVKIFGAHLIIPFLLNVVITLILLAVLQKWLVRNGINPLSQLLILLGVIYLTPLPPLTMSGMEHSLQLLVVFLFLSRFTEEIEHELTWKTYLYATLMVMTRYEGLPLLAVACLILVIRRKIFAALQLGIYPAIPIVLFGIYSMYNGNFFFPNSVLLKSGAPPLTFDGLYKFFTNGIFTKLFYSLVGYNTVATQRLLFLLPLAFLLFQKKMSASQRYMLLLLMAGVFIHLCLTGYASFPRYEAYLIGCSVAILGMLTAKYGRELFTRARGLSAWIGGLAGALLILPLLLRSNFAFEEVWRGTVNTYQLQFTVGQFLHKYYNTTPVAVEALGAASYYTEGKKLDIVGLGDIEVARSVRGHYYGVNFLDTLSKQEGIQLAAASEYSTPAPLLERWKRVATWYAPRKYGEYYISFFAVDSTIAPDLKRHLQEYQQYLPEGERVVYH